MLHSLLAAEAGAEAATLPIIPTLIGVPLVGAILVALGPRNRPEVSRQIAFMTTAITAVLSFWMLREFEVGKSGYQFEVDQTWVADLGISLHFGIDGISLFLVVLTGLLFPIAVLAAEPARESKPYYAWILMLEAGSMGVFAALDLFLFFVCFEIVLVPMYFLIGKWGHGNRIYAATKFFVYTMAGSAMMLVGILATAFLSQDALGELTFDLVKLSEADAIGDTASLLIFISFALAFAVKVPIFPFHTWLPDAHTEAPTAGSIILAGIMLKLGTYGFMRFGITLFPQQAVDLAPILVTLGVIGIIYGAIAAAMQSDLKRLVAYSSVAHMGFVVLGIFAFTSQSLSGSVLQMVNHGISTGALFILVGWIYERRHTRDIGTLSGLQKSAPIMAAVFTLVMLSSIGLPGLNGFVGEYLILVGGFLTRRWYTVVAVAGVILAALYLLWAYQRVFHGPADGENIDMPDMTFTEGLIIAPLLALIVFLGVYPKPLLDRIEPSIDEFVEHVENRSDFTAPVPSVIAAEDDHSGGAESEDEDH